MAEKGSAKSAKSKRNNRLDMRVDPDVKEKWEKAAQDLGGSSLSLTSWVLIACNEQCKRQGIK